MIAEAKFWDGIARKYSKDPIKNTNAYEATLERVRARLGADDSVLEIGCGTGSTALRLAEYTGHYTGTDISGKMIEIAREKLADGGPNNLDFTVAPTLETRFSPQQFDAVLGFNILHLVEDLPATVARAQQVLKPGGLFITKTPCLRDMGFYIRPMIAVMQFFGKAPFVSNFRKETLVQTIKDAGFEIIESRTFEKSPNSRYLVAQKR